MQHKCRVEVIDKKVFPEFQTAYLADPNSGVCPFYNVGDVFVFERYGGEDTFFRMAKGAHCSEAWDCISRYIYAALQGGSIMRGWTKDDRMMIACCNDGTRPVIFKIERLDYKVLKMKGMKSDGCAAKIKEALEALPNVEQAEPRLDKGWVEVFAPDHIMPEDSVLVKAVEALGNYTVTGID